MNFFLSLFKVISYAFAGRLHFPRNRVGKEFIMDGERWIIFREAVVDPGKDQPAKPGAIFRPRFHVAGSSPEYRIFLASHVFHSWPPRVSLQAVDVSPRKR